MQLHMGHINLNFIDYQVVGRYYLKFSTRITLAKKPRHRLSSSECKHVPSNGTYMYRLMMTVTGVTWRSHAGHVPARDLRLLGDVALLAVTRRGRGVRLKP